MRAPSSHLHQLIHSLSKEEKKQITIHLKGLGQKGKAHIQLFNAMYKQATYDEKALKQSFSAKTFSAAKRRLYDLIMDVLLLIEKQDLVRQRVKKGLRIFDILHKKRLYEKARQHIYELEALAEKHELFGLLTFIYIRIDRLESGKYAYTNFTDESFAAYIAKKRLNQQKFHNIQDYMYLQGELRYITVKFGSNWQEKLENIYQNPLLSDASSPKSHSAQLLFHTYNMACAQLKKEQEQTWVHAWATVRIFEEHLLSIRTKEDYVVCLFNAMYALFDANNREDLTEFFKKIEAEVPLVKHSQYAWQQALIIFKAKYYAMRGEAENGRQFLQQYGDWLFEQIDALHQIVFFSFGTLYFFDGKYEKTQACLEAILNKPYQGNEQIIVWAKLFQLITFFEEGTIDLMESLSRSLYRKLQQNKETYIIELAIVKSLKKLVAANKSEEQILLKQLHQTLKAFQVSDQPTIKILLEYFNYIAWVEAKLTNQSFATILATAHKSSVT